MTIQSLCDSGIFTSNITPVNEHQGGGEEELPPLARALIDGIVTVSAGAAGLLNPDWSMVAAGAVPPVSLALSRAAAVVAQRRRRNVAKMLAEAERRAELEEAQLLERLVSTPARQELLATAVEAAARATLEEKTTALGQALARGILGNGDAVDQEQLFVRAIADLEVPHARVLARLGTSPAPGYRPSLISRTLAEADGGRDVIGPVLAVLERCGAAEKIPAINDVKQLSGDLVSGFGQQRQPTWRITAFGQRLLEHLSDAANGDGA